MHHLYNCACIQALKIDSIGFIKDTEEMKSNGVVSKVLYVKVLEIVNPSQ